ncbi:MAG: TlpA family protein disulfide reductase [Candidatus Eremiobacteraeota bacterium]|nr:TlpA family protein disulfide reductase [Candidatus Eremiobacteraeota bacterium]
MELFTFDISICRKLWPGGARWQGAVCELAKWQSVFRWIAGGLAVAAVIVLIAAFYPNGNTAGRGPQQAVGSSLPALSFPSLDHHEISLQSLRGKDVVLNVWATWCGPCRREMPALAMLARGMGSQLSVVAIDQGEDPSVVARYVKEFNVRFPVAVDSSQRLGTTLHLIGLPSSFFIDRSGTIREAVDGELTYQMMSDKARRLLASDAKRS